MSGPLVFHLRLPFELAPTMNVYAHLPRWERGKLAKRVDAMILDALRGYPNWRAGFTESGAIVRGKLRVTRVGGRRRDVVVTRESSRRLDEESVDVAGGKIPIDRLVLAGVLVGDSKKWIDRAAKWVPAHPGQGAVTIDVYELG